MAIETKKFTVAGLRFRVRQFNAVRGLKILSDGDNASPDDMFSETEVESGGEWFRLDSRESINEHLTDPNEIFLPYAIMEEAIREVKSVNFAFLVDWKGVKIPSRFLSSAKTVSTGYSAPIVSNLIQADKATLRELEEYYSVEDAFKMFDIVLTNTVNKSLAHEEAEKEAKRGRK